MISLIVSTLDRTVELNKLLDSLEEQTYRDFEVIVVDQNADDRLTPVLAEHNQLCIRHIHSGRGLSKGRNAGLDIARGDILAIPDDDCWYPPQLLDLVQRWFGENSNCSALLTGVRGDAGEAWGPRRRSKVACECDRRNIWHCGISCNMFFGRRLADSVGRFDERLGTGAGTMFQSGEETDYLLRALAQGHRFWFDPGMFVCHPLHPISHIRKQTYPYALGTGFVLRKHAYSPWRLAADFLSYSFGGALVAMSLLDFKTAEVRALRGAGQVMGYLRAGSALRAGDIRETETAFS